MGVLNQRLVDISLNKVKERLRLEGVMVGEDINFAAKSWPVQSQRLFQTR